LASCLLAVSVSADPKPKKDKTPKELLKERVCKDGAYVRPKPKAEAKPDAKDKDKKDAPSLPTGLGGLFSSAGGDDGVSKFTPSDDCSSEGGAFDKLFEPGADGAVPADSLEIAAATKDGAVPGPEKFTSLSGLTHLLANKAQSPELMKGFFDGSATPAGLKEIQARSAAADSAAAGGDGAVLAGVVNKPWPKGMIESKKIALDNREPPSPGAHKAADVVTPPPPKEKFNPQAADIPPAVPASRPFWSGLGNDFSAVRNDYNSGGGMISNEGFFSRDTTNANYVPPPNGNPNPSITVPLPGAPVRPGAPENAPEAPGINPRCKPGCYGTDRMISLLKSMGEQYHNYIGGSLNVGGISLYQGGPFPPHVSHRLGVDADITFVNNGGGFAPVENAMIVASVVRALSDFRHINGREYILCDQSKHAAIGRGLDFLVKQGVLKQEDADRGKSVLVHWPGHNDHFHVRIL